MEGKNKKILVVDDDNRILESLKDILESEGYTVETTKTGEEAVKRNKNNFFDMALLDIKLPGIQGTELLEILHRESPRMVKIMMTGFPSLENAIASLKFGADAYIMKPVNPEKLLDVVKKKFKEREKHD